PTERTSIRRQSKATTAETSTGLPVERVSHPFFVKRLAPLMPVRPAKRSAMLAPPSPSVLTQNTPFSRMAGLVWLLRCRHASKVGGAPDTEQRAVPVDPSLPRGPPVVMT